MPVDLATSVPAPRSAKSQVSPLAGSVEAPQVRRLVHSKRFEVRISLRTRRSKHYFCRAAFFLAMDTKVLMFGMSRSSFTAALRSSSACL